MPAASGRSLVDTDRDVVAGSDLFEADWYTQEYPDIAKAGVDPALHYVRHGAGEGRDPGPAFNTREYVSQHEDVAASGDNPLIHYLRVAPPSELSRGRTGARDSEAGDTEEDV